MSGNYTEIKIPVTGEELRSVLIARLESIGYESFVEDDDQLTAYIPVQYFDGQRLNEALSREGKELTYSQQTQQDKNWNEEWEKNYPPVVVSGKCHIRAPFHQKREDIPMEILIEPKMAFGTAHHETTAMMIEWGLETGFKGKKVLDMGCGTGVLAILANKLGASDVLAVDNDEWACRNAAENISLNEASQCTVIPGDASIIEGLEFDVIFANINRNILVRDIPAYSRALKEGGTLFLSGFYRQDIQVIMEVAKHQGLASCGEKVKSDWTALCLRKSSS